MCSRLCGGQRACCTFTMRPLRHLSLVLATALGLAPLFALAQSPSGGAPPQPNAAAAANPQAERQPEKPRQARKPAGKRAQAGADRPVATFPGFRMLPDGGSRVFVQVSGKVGVAESKAEGRVVYRLKG